MSVVGPIIPIEGNTLGSWLAHLGSFGFTGAEKLAYKPIDIIGKGVQLSLGPLRTCDNPYKEY